MSLRRRLTLSLFAILLFFSVNVGTHFWGSYARIESMAAYRNTVNAAQLSTQVERLLAEQRQRVLVLATLRETNDDMLDSGELTQAEDELAVIFDRIRELGDLSHDVTQLQYDRLWQAASIMLNDWLDFYRNYNDGDYAQNMNDPAEFRQVSSLLQELEQQQAFIAVQRASIIDRTIALTDRITVIGFVASILLTGTLGFFLIRYTNSSLKRLKTGTQRIGSGDLNYRIVDMDDRGELGDLADAFNDMSDKLRNAINEVSDARDTADRASAAKSMFLANVSHELRTPLNAIIGYSEMLHDELGDTQEVDRHQFQLDLDKIIRSGRQLLGLINDILDLSKIESGKMSMHRERFNPSQVLSEVADSLAPLVLARGNLLDLSGLGDTPEVDTDLKKFRQIFTNLLSNANKFTDGGGIHLSARKHLSEHALLEFCVADTGIGMDREQQERVFDAFVQAENSTSANYGGTGLGLSICKEFCEMMGGSISVESEPGGGSTFTVTLPLDPESVRAVV